MNSEKPWFQSALLCGWLLCAAMPAQSAVLDFLFGKKAGEVDAAQLDPKQREWRLGEFTSIRLVPREPDAAGNQHPAQRSPESLRLQLSLVRADLRGGEQPLFAADELADLVGPLSQALALAGPGDDVLLLSTHRRGNGIVMAPFGLTARLFVQDDNLQLIVHDARLDFVDTYIGTRVPPTFTFGARGKAGKAVLHSASAVNRRADWLSIPAVVSTPAVVNSVLAAPVGSAPVAVQPAVVPTAASTTPTPAPAATVKASPATPSAVPVSPSQPVLRPRDAGYAEEVEQRLVTLKRLFDRGLITESEYQQKRKEVLQSL